MIKKSEGNVMMKNLRKNALISLLMVLAIVILLTRTVNASGELIQASGELLLVNKTSENQTTQNVATNTAQNTTPVNVVPTNIVKVNNINDASKDIPQTGENDIYMITGIGIAAIVIGGIAFAKSKKYDIQ